MGVLYDYFRAADDASVAALMESLDGGSPWRGGEAAVDLVDLKGIDPVVILGQLVAFVLDIEWEMDLSEDDTVWPPEHQLEEYDGPIVSRLHDSAREALASITEEQVPELAERWSQIEEFEYVAQPAQEWADLVTEISGLARRARDNGEHLYCWSSL